MNNVMLVGRIVKDLELKETENKKSYCFVTLAVNRTYKNAEGEYETDFIDVIVWNELASNLVQYSKKGDLIGVRANIETRIKEENEVKTKITSIVANKVSYLVSKKSDEVKEA